MFKSILKTPQSSVGMGIAVGGLTYAAYSFCVPSVSVLHATAPNDANVEKGRKKAAITAGIAVIGVTALTRDINVFIIGGVLLVALDFSVRHGNATHPVTGELVSPDATSAIATGSVSAAATV